MDSFGNTISCSFWCDPRVIFFLFFPQPYLLHHALLLERLRTLDSSPRAHRATPTLPSSSDGGSGGSLALGLAAPRRPTHPPLRLRRRRQSCSQARRATPLPPSPRATSAMPRAHPRPWRSSSSPPFRSAISHTGKRRQTTRDGGKVGCPRPLIFVRQEHLASERYIPL